MLVNDEFGADDTTATHVVTGVSAGSRTDELTSGVGTAIEGTYGYLKLNADGTYTYTLKTGTDGKPIDITADVQDVFSYTIQDSDGDWSTTSITVNVSADTNEPSITLPSADSGATTVYESSLDETEDQPAGSDSELSKDKASGEITLNLNGESGTLTIDGKIIELDADGNATNLTSANNTITTEHGTLTITSIENGTVKYEYQLDGAQEHADVQGNNTLTDEIAISVTDATHDTASGNLTITIVDDVPTISVSDISSTVIPGGGAGNLENGEKASFTDQGDAGRIIAQGTKLDGWDGVTMYAGKVTYTTDTAGNTVIGENGLDTSANYYLQYSTYPTEGKPSSDWGLMVGSPGDAQAWEINVSKDGKTSEAVVFDLGGQLAYGVTIDFGAFYNGEPGATGTTQWDHVSEKALVTFYRDGQIVGSTVVEGNSPDGKFTLNSSDVVLGGFDKVVISAVDNSTTQFPNENSDFTIQGIDFITKRDDPIIINEGKVTAESGADGFADAYADSHAKFDLAGMVDKNGGTLNEDGTSGTIMVLMDGSEQKVTLELSEGLSGESILTGTLADGEQLFTATLDKNGNWTMEQYDQFRIPGEEGQESSNKFDLVFKTEDADGDIRSTTVNVPLEVVDQTINADNEAVSNGNDTIVITGGDGVAGTVAAGDSGGVDVITNVQPGQDYNISIMLDLSGSMNNGGSGFDGSKLAMAQAALTTFINETLAKHDGAINLQFVTFSGTAEQKGTWKLLSSTNAEAEDNNQAQITSIVNTLSGLSASGGTNYEAALKMANDWFNDTPSKGGVFGNGGENLAFFITDGQPTLYGNGNQGDGNHSDNNTVTHALTAAQQLQAANGGVNINAIGIGEALEGHGKDILDLIDNTTASGETTPTSTYWYEEPSGSILGIPYGWGWHDGERPGLAEGNADLVYTTDGLKAALVGGSEITSTDLADAGNDTITAENSDSSVIIYGDVMNTDRLLYELKQLELSNLVMAGAVVSALPDYGSGTQVFQWLEDNSANLKGDYAGWTHDDTLKYMLEHAEELGYETRVGDDGTFYLVTADGTVLDMDGSESELALDNLTGRGGGNDTITGSRASDTIYGQEGDDLLVGDAPSESGEGSTVDSIEGTTVDSIKKMSIDDLDAFIQSVEGTDADGDDRLFGGTGDDVLLGMGGDDYIDGGEGSDAIFGGRGNDIIVYDSNDYLVSGGSGIDFMVSDDSALTLTTLLQGAGDGDGPIVNSIEVLITGKDALSLTSIQELADKYGITLGTNPDGQETLTLDMSKWDEDTSVNGTHVFTSSDGQLTLETNLQHDSAASSDNGEMAQQVFILQNSNS